jgi:hypothetical protein
MAMGGTMQYRTFGKLDWKVSALGFGCMRLPTTDSLPLSSNVVEAEAIRMIRHAIDNGVNYVDTAYMYHGGMSEVVLGKALRDGYREKVKLATKLPVWMVQRPEDFDRILGEQLQRLQTDHIDCYLLHALGKERWHNLVLKYNLIEKAEQAKADGRIRHIGFSFHDKYEGFETVINGYDRWDFCQIQYNYMDTENQAGVKGLKLAASKGLAVVVMEPLLGGRLADPPKEICALIDAAEPHRTPAELALNWLWNQPEVSVVLSGMSTMEQVEQNLGAAINAHVGGLAEADQKLIARATEMYKARTAIPCTKCEYCMPCPNGVNIPANFEFFNHASLYEDVHGARFRYSVFLKPEERSSACIACHDCEELCPQAIPISEWMPKVAALLG